MAKAKDPTLAIRKVAASFPDVTEGTSCNQTSFKTGKRSFLFIGPGNKGVGFKAMFKLERSVAQAEKLAVKEPDRFQVGKDWITVRFTAEKPLSKSVWEKWLAESYQLAIGGKAKSKQTKTTKNSSRRKVASSTSRKKTKKKESNPKR